MSGHTGQETVVPAFLRQFDDSTLQAHIQKVSLSSEEEEEEKEEMTVEMRCVDADVGDGGEGGGEEEGEAETLNNTRVNETFNKIRLGNFDFVSSFICMRPIHPIF